MKRITRLLELCLLINAHTRRSAFFKLYGHVESVTVEVCEGKSQIVDRKQVDAIAYHRTIAIKHFDLDTSNNEYNQIEEMLIGILYEEEIENDFE